MGGGGSPSRNRMIQNGKWPEQQKSCEVHSIILQVFYSALYQVPNLLLLLLLLFAKTLI